jgi:hypothetical protein
MEKEQIENEKETAYYGFDLGDAESAIAKLPVGGKGEPRILPVRGQGSFITAYAALSDGTLLVGEEACYAVGAVRRKLRFKSVFLTDPGAAECTATFARGALGELYAVGDLTRGQDAVFYLGCPAGWDANTRERYREIFVQAGYPPVRIVSESRAAMICACQSRHLQVGTDILKKPVLVVDIGSSTTDFAYIRHGREEKLQTGGEVHLGGGILDELLLEQCIKASGLAEKRIRRDLAESEPWRSYCEFAARRLKEQYFANEGTYREEGLAQSVVIALHTPVRLKLYLDGERAKQLLNTGSERLGGKSFREAFLASLQGARDGIAGEQPELLFLTGGVSRLPAIRDWCSEVFPNAVLVTSAEPEYSVAKGLAYAAGIDASLSRFREELNAYIASDRVETVVGEGVPALYQSAVQVLTEPLLREAALPALERWRQGEIRRLQDVDDVMQENIRRYVRSEQAQKLLEEPVRKWLSGIAPKIEQDTVPLCVRNGVPVQSLSLSSYLDLPDVSIGVHAGDVFAVREITLLVDAVISVLVGMLCGGGGIALIASGLPGIAAGVVLSLAVLFLGRGQMEKALLSANIPVPIRKLIPKGYFRARLGSIGRKVQEEMAETVRTNQSAELTSQLTKEISGQIEQCLLHMAEVVEIPLG